VLLFTVARWRWPGEEIQGIAVHEASRIMSHAGPGEVLVSDLTRILARDPQMRFEDLGDFELRGMDERLRLHSVTEPDPT
jgi:class 3 adenylate cyclase